MAYSKTPSTFFGAGYSLSASEVKMTTATAGSNNLLTKLTDAEANATTGDWREICWSICYALYSKWAALSNSSKPTKAKFSKTIVANPDLTTQTETYIFVFTTTINPSDVAAE